VSLSKKLNEIKFPNRVPNSPYSIKATVPATPISMMMELKSWLRVNVQKVHLVPEVEISTIAFSFIKKTTAEETNSVAKQVNSIIDESLKNVLNKLIEKEGRRIDYQKSFDGLMNMYGKEGKTLAFRILDELLMKE